MVRPETTSQTFSHRTDISLSASSSLVDNLFSEKNRYRLLLGGGTGLVFLLAILLIVISSKRQTANALESLRNGIALLQNGKNEEAISQLDKANRQFRAGDKAQLAEFYLLEAYRKTGEVDKVKIILERTDQSTKDSGYPLQMLLLTQGRNAEKRNDLQAARKAYEEAAALEGPFVGDALLALTRITEASGDVSAAMAAREKYLVSYPNSPLADVMRQKSGK